ncbi:MAG: hypothetical protein H8E44_27355 [Planctomycetes bacterium]|nr:hypothetical protein [Planctomycetota bacterium]MBL7044362.1 hypothetical protein [Pirellulaceae bacterium]
MASTVLTDGRRPTPLRTLVAGFAGIRAFAARSLIRGEFTFLPSFRLASRSEYRAVPHPVSRDLDDGSESLRNTAGRTCLMRLQHIRLGQVFGALKWILWWLGDMFWYNRWAK